MVPKVASLTLEVATKIVRRHFHSADQFVLVGDRHTNSKTIKFHTNQLGTSRQWIVRFGATAEREVQVYESLLGLITAAGHPLHIPTHRLLEPGVMVRDFVPGVTLSQINTSFVGSIEAVGVLRDSAGLPANVAHEIMMIVFGPHLTQSSFFQHIRHIFRSWLSYKEWEHAVAVHLAIPLAGEALRKPLDLLYNWHTSAVKFGSPDSRPSWKEIRESLNSYLQHIYKTEDIFEIGTRIYSQVDELREIASAAALYDIHYDNLVLNEDNGKIYLIDLECAGLGYADFANANLQFVDDLIQHGVSNSPPIWANGWNPPLRDAPVSPPLPVAFSGKARIILCGTSSYLRIIRTALETIFYVFAFKWNLCPPLDENDLDIREFPEPWRSFQKLKRIARGCSSSGSAGQSQLLDDVLRMIIYDEDCSEKFREKCEIESFRSCLQSQVYENKSMAHLVSLRVAEYLRFLPFELLLHRKILRSEFDYAIAHLGEEKTLSELELIFRTTLADILAGNVPYHLWEQDGRFSIDSSLMRRICRKIKIVERVQSIRSEYWLNVIIAG